MLAGSRRLARALQAEKISMAHKSFRLIICVVALLGFGHLAYADGSCPRTIGADKVFQGPWPQSGTWFGSDALAVMLPDNGIWPTTVEGHLIAVKLFWFSAGFEPGMERDFVGRIERLDGGPDDASISPPTNAGLSNDVWTILTGLDFKSAGCWQITDEYRGQSLAFVVETIDYSEYKRQRSTSE